MSDQETLTAHVGRRLRAARLQAGMTVREAATSETNKLNCQRVKEVRQA